MSDFSKLLSRFIKEKKISVSSMVEYCGIDRSAMYKIIKGKRNPPSLEIRDRISHFMRLTPEESRLFNQAYEISLTGKDVYEKRKQAEKFILNFPAVFQTEYSSFCSSSSSERPEILPEKKCTAFSSQNMFYFYAQQIIESEADSENGQIGLLLQPDSEFLFSFLTGLKLSGSPCFIDHIFCMNHFSKGETSYNNLDTLSRLLPLFINGIHYRPYFFYDNVHSHYHNLNAFSSMILTKKYAITCTADLKNGILHKDPKTITMLWKLFHSYKAKCHPLFYIPNSVIEDGSMVQKTVKNCSELYFIEPEPCLIPFISESILPSLLPEDHPNRETMFSYMYSYLKESKKSFSKADMHFYFCKNELDRFAETGILTELPRPLSDTYALSVKERIELLEKIFNSPFKVHYHFLKEPFLQAASRLRLCVGENSMYLQFLNNQLHRSYLFLQEPEIIEILFDYLKNIDKNTICSEEETLAYFRETINWLKKKEKENEPCLTSRKS